jgi:chorismate mutase
MIKTEISGLIERIIYKTSDFCVFSVDDVMTVTTKGKNNHYIEDIYVKVKGNQIISKKYGQQIEATSINILPVPGSFIYFLIKKKVKYIGEKSIEKLKKAFGDDLLDFLKKDPESVKKVINNKKSFNELTTYFQKREEKLKNIRIIDKYNLDPAYLEKIFKAYEKNIRPAFYKELFKTYKEYLDPNDHFKRVHPRIK